MLCRSWLVSCLAAARESLPASNKRLSVTAHRMQRLVCYVSAFLFFLTLTYNAQGQTPHLSSLSPDNGPVGTRVTMTGSGFGTMSWTVSIGGQSATIVSWSDTQIVATVGNGAQTGTAYVHIDRWNIVPYNTNTVPFTVVAVALNPTSLSFGSQVIPTTSATQTVTLTNPLPGALSISSIAVSGDYAQTSNCGTSLAANATCTINVAFSPTGTGTRNGTLTVTDNANNSPQTAALTGVGIVAASVSPTSFVFAQQLVGTTSTAQATILTNNQSAALSISSIATSGDYAQTNNCGTSLAGGGSCTINVTFTPTGAATRNGTLTVTDNANNSPQTASLTGVGLLPASLSPATLAFAPQPVGTTSAAQAITLTNNQSTSLSISGVAAAGDFAQTNNCGTSLAGGASCTINITFTPTAAGTRTGTLTVTDSAPNSPQTALLSGISPNGPIKYFYDSLGRLTAVSDGLGNSANYSYDAVGNILSISTHTPSQVSIFTFYPQSGPVSTQVKISGHGFSGTPSQNTVTFNGTPATVSLATSDQLTVIVPTGAQTGPINITSPAGSASTGAPFTVTSAPVISSVSPGISEFETITGLNFDPNPNNDQVTFNGTPEGVASATSTTITTQYTTFGATSGRISVTTPNGTAVGPDVFFPFATSSHAYTASDIDYTARMNIGDTVSITTDFNHGSTPIAVIVFDGIQGQDITASISNGGVGNCKLHVFLAQRDLGATTFACGNFVALTLPATATYTLGIESDPNNSMTLSLATYKDIVANIQPDGPAVQIPTRTFGQKTSLWFPGTANQHLVLTLNNYTDPFCCTVSLLDPKNNTVTSFTYNNGQDIVNLPLLPSTGLYTILIDTKFGTKPFSAQLANVTDVTGTITTDGTLTTATTTTPNQYARLSFTGSLNQRLSLVTSAVTFPSSANIFLQRPDGTTISWGTAPNPGGAFLGIQTLAADGNYAIVVGPGTISTSGSVGLQLYNVPPDATASATTGGPSVTVQTTAPGQRAHVTFDSQINGNYTAHFTSNTMTNGGTQPVTISAPPCSSAFISSAASSFDLPMNNCTQSGATIDITPTGANTGSITVAITSP